MVKWYILIIYCYTQNYYHWPRATEIFYFTASDSADLGKKKLVLCFSFSHKLNRVWLSLKFSSEHLMGDKSIFEPAFVAYQTSIPGVGETECLCSWRLVSGGLAWGFLQCDPLSYQSSRRGGWEGVRLLARSLSSQPVCRDEILPLLPGVPGSEGSLGSHLDWSSRGCTKSGMQEVRGDEGSCLGCRLHCVLMCCLHFPLSGFLLCLHAAAP